MKLLCIWIAAIHFSAFSQSTIDQLAKCVVVLQITHPVLEQVGTNQSEVFFRAPGGTNYTPKVKAMLGTGFLINHTNGPHSRTYIATAKHVVGGTSYDGKVIFFDAKHAPVEISLQLIRQNLPGARWFLHPKADIAVHPFWVNSAIANSGIPELMMSTNDLELLSPVCAIGFPLALGIGKEISPLVTQCQIASWMRDVPQNLDVSYTILDKALAQGYSGCPIFTLPAPLHDNSIMLGTYAPKFVGLYSSQMLDEAGGKLSLIVPSKYLIELFQTADLLAYENP